MNAREADIQRLKEKIELVYNQYKAVSRQYQTTLNEGDKPALEEQKLQYKAEYEALDAQLKRLKAGELPLTDPRELRRCPVEEWGEKVYLLDFTDPLQIFRNLLNAFEREDAALLLVQHARRRMAEHFARRIYDVMQHESSIGIPRKTLGFEDSASLTPDEFLSRLSRWFGDLTTTNGQDASVDRVITAIYNSLGGGQTLFIDITCAELPGSFLHWFLRDF
jgi:hypothetical protein